MTTTAPRDEAAVPAAVARYARHSPYSDPGVHASLLRDVDPATPAVSAVARNLIAHYRGEAHLLPAHSRDDVDLRWLADQLATDQARHGVPLVEARPLPERLQGCCRDHSLFTVGVLREHGVPARTRIGFAGYFNPAFHHDHVVVERFDGGRWVRFDPELGEGFTEEFDVTDMPTGLGSPFETAAEVWLAYRSGALDADGYGVDPSMPMKGPRFVAAYVVAEVAHRHGDELLLWDVWGAELEQGAGGSGPDLGDPSGTRGGQADLVTLIDRVAELLVAADAEERAGDLAGPAAAELAALYAGDDRVHPGAEIGTLTPLVPDAPLRRVRLR